MLKATVLGNVGSDPELRYTAGGSAVLSFSLVSNGRMKNAAGKRARLPSDQQMQQRARREQAMRAS